MMNYVIMLPSSDELRHFGIKGQKWGVRRFQNEDRTWTEAGKERYGNDSGLSKRQLKKQAKREAKELDTMMKLSKKAFTNHGRAKALAKLQQNEMIKRLASDKELTDKAIRANNRLLDYGQSQEYERNLGVYGEDFDGWMDNDPKANKENYGINQKQFDEIMRRRDDRKKIRKEALDLATEYDAARKEKVKQFIKDYMSKPYAKIKLDAKKAEQYETYVGYVIDEYVDSNYVAESQTNYKPKST